MDVPVRPGDALSQPTRARVFALLGELGRPAATEELAEELGLHPNGIRIHLERLLKAGLVERRLERIDRGRPRDTWTISADAQPGGDPPTGYASLSRWLVRSLVASGARVRDLEATGRGIGQGLAAEYQGAGSAEQALFDGLAALGFQPVREPVVKGRVSYRLRNCPYREAVHERQPLVCALHRGLTSGFLEIVDPDSKLVGFEPKDPDLAGCMIRVRGPVARDVPGSDGAA
ncbi:MAG TPA: helix-turn-helix domain-containing protein [Solirubrobacteraceae bacterium]|nr:helix-turn-helix domain-containing protein [Solirubrobacteraceae bacterium]